jgi:hypothetical protein
MMATSVASSHQSASASIRPSSTTQEKTNATAMASEMSVIMPGSFARSSLHAPWTKTQPPYTKTNVPRTGPIQSDPGKAGAV